MFIPVFFIRSDNRFFLMDASSPIICKTYSSILSPAIRRLLHIITAEEPCSPKVNPSTEFGSISKIFAIMRFSLAVSRRVPVPITCSGRTPAISGIRYVRTSTGFERQMINSSEQYYLTSENISVALFYCSQRCSQISIYPSVP